jgi:predicted thioesterase
MKNPFQIGDVKIYTTTVTPDKLATFETGNVHPVYSTFALARDAEWACRLFVLEMKEAGEEGIGAYLSVEHLAPALLGATVEIRAVLEAVEGNRIECSYQVFCGKRILATGKQTQKIIQKDKFDAYLETLK